MRKTPLGVAAFTLIELLLVLVILGILAAIVVPKFAGRTEQARLTAAATQISSFGTALDAFDLIVPCGLKGSRATSLKAESGRTLQLSYVAARFADRFGHATGREIEWKMPSELHERFAFSNGVRTMSVEGSSGREVA